MADPALAWEPTTTRDDMREAARAEAQAFYRGTCREWHNDPVRSLIRAAHQAIRERKTQ